MKKKNLTRKPPGKSNRFSTNGDPFFTNDSKKRRKMDDDEVVSDAESSESEKEHGVRQALAGGEKEEETADEKRKRMAMSYLEKIRQIAGKEEGEEEGEESDEGEKEGKRDSLVAKILQQEQMEESGRVRRLIASRVHKPKDADEFHVLVKHRQSVTAVALSEDDMKGYSASKDGTIIHWDVDSGKSEKYLWPGDDVLKSHGAKDPQGKAKRHSKVVLALAVSSDGRYLASGGLDRHIHLWDVRTREHIQAFPGHRGPVSCLTFRQGTSELFSGSFDRTIKIWNVEDRAYINSLFGHQGEVLTIDCLRKERVLAVGRDRSMQLFKVPEESRLVFRAPASSLECCCFIGNDELLSGSDDGSVEVWSILRKKPLYIAKGAHSLLSTHDHFDKCDNGQSTNGSLDNGNHNFANNFASLSVHSWVSSVAVCRSSDLAASGAGSGYVRLWAIENESRGIRPLHDLPLAGFVNSLAFAKSGQFLVAGTGQEPRLGRWGRIPATRNGVAVHSINLS